MTSIEQSIETRLSRKVSFTRRSTKQVVEERRLHGALAGNGSSRQEAIIGLATGAVFGMVNPVVGHPFDLIKTKMQTSNHYVSFTETVKLTYRSDGVRGFYRGFIPPLIGSIAFRSALFSTYSGTYAACSKVAVLDEPMPYTGGLKPSVLIAAISAAGVRAFIETPLEFIKVRIMVGKTTMQGAGQLESFSSTHAVSHIRHLYSGFTPTLFRTIGLLGSFFVMVDYSVRYIPDVINAPLVGPFFKGGVCATAAWTFAFPFESAKSVIQADHTGKYRNMRNATWVVMKQLYQERGFVRGLYRGFGPGAGRSFVANGTSMLVYSWCQDLIRTNQ